MALKTNVEAALKAELSSDFVVSAVFPRKTALSRQELLRQAMRAESVGLSQSEVGRVISILALTPAKTTAKGLIPRRKVVVPN